MDIDFRLIGIIISIVIWIFTHISFIFFWNRTIGDGNPQKTHFARIKIFWDSLFNIISLIILIVLKFKFWYINLIFSFHTIFALILSIEVNGPFYINKLFSKIANNKTTRKNLKYNVK